MTRDGSGTTEPQAASAVTVHIVEPAARDLAGHYFNFCADCARCLGGSGYRTRLYVAADAETPQLAGALTGAELVGAFSYLASEPYRRARAGRMTDADPLSRRVIRHEIIPRLRHVARVLRVRDRVRAENLTYRLDNAARGVAARIGPSVAERETAAIAAQDLRSLLAQDFAPSEAHHLFLATGEIFTLQALGAAIPDGACDALSAIHIRLWQFLSLECPGADLRPAITRLTRAADARGVRLFWYCEVPWAQSYLQARLHRPVGYMDVNAFKPPTAVDGAGSAAPRGTARPPVLLFPGAVRRYPDKGLSFIAELAELLANDPAFAIQMQAIPEKHGDREFRLVFDRESARMKTSGVVDFLPGIVEGDHYARALRDCFAVAMPYDGLTWLDRYRGSGVFLEALLYEKPLFVRRGLPLSKYAGLYDFAEFSTPAELATLARQTLDGTRTFDLAGNRRRYGERLARNDMLANLRAGG